jgi:hypothetical protein
MIFCHPYRCEKQYIQLFVLMKLRSRSTNFQSL